ncbi:MAG: thiamine pyrophosphate-dependent enzyme [Patescibacteria group bacterium]
MRRDEALTIVYDAMDEKAVFIFTNGRISREGYLKRDAPRNFYMLASMGKTVSIGLGIALERKERRVVVIDGDGNVLMNLDNLAMVGYLQPANLVHVVLDNEIYATTGGQETLSAKIDLSEVAKACGYPSVWRVQSREELQAALEQIREKQGPHFLLAKVEKEQLEGTKIIPYTPEEIKTRFMGILAS